MWAEKFQYVDKDVTMHPRIKYSPIIREMKITLSIWNRVEEDLSLQYSRSVIFQYQHFQWTTKPVFHKILTKTMAMQCIERALQCIERALQCILTIGQKFTSFFYY
jgi:hypothetical protein